MKKLKLDDGSKRKPLERRVFHVEDSWSFIVSQRKSDGTKLTIDELSKINKVLSRTRKECAEKELELRNTAGPASTPERHYPKSFTIQPKKEEE